jgi:flagellar protein FliO/FliZ
VLSGDTGMAELGIRLVCSLAVVIGLLVLIARLVNRRFKASTGAPVQVVHRQSLTRSSGVAVVTVGTRVLVLGTTEQQVTLLAEVEPDEIGLDELYDDGAADEAPRLTSVPSSGPRPAAIIVRRTSADTSRRPGAHRAAPTARAGGRRTPVEADGPLAGSLLSPQTWRQTFAAFGGPAATGDRRERPAS